MFFSPKFLCYSLQRQCIPLIVIGLSSCRFGPFWDPFRNKSNISLSYKPSCSSPSLPSSSPSPSPSSSPSKRITFRRASSYHLYTLLLVYSCRDSFAHRNQLLFPGYKKQRVNMELPDSSQDLSSEMEVDAFRRIFPLRFFERHLSESLRPDARPLGKARDTIVNLGLVSSADGSALAKIGSTTMLAAIRMEVMTPSIDSPDEGCIAIEFHMPPICSPTVRPGRPAEAAPVISKRLSDTILSSGMIDLKELCLVSGKAAWMGYLDIYCLDADGALFDAALLSAVAAFSSLQIPVVALNDNGRIVAITGEEQDNASITKKEAVNKEKRNLTLKNIPFSLTCILHKNYILADPTAEEESIMDTLVTVVLDSSDHLVSLYKSGGTDLGNTSAVKGCVELARKRAMELKQILGEMDID